MTVRLRNPDSAPQHWSHGDGPIIHKIQALSDMRTFTCLLNLLSLYILHAQQNQVPIIQIGRGQSCTVFQVGVAVRQLHFAHRQRGVNNLDDSVSQSRYQKVERKVWNFDDRTIELPFGFVGNRGKLHRKGNGIRVHTDPVGFLRGRGELLVFSRVSLYSRDRTAHRAALQFLVVWVVPDPSVHPRRVLPDQRVAAACPLANPSAYP